LDDAIGLLRLEPRRDDLVEGSPSSGGRDELVPAGAFDDPRVRPEHGAAATHRRLDRRRELPFGRPRHGLAPCPGGGGQSRETDLAGARRSCWNRRHMDFDTRVKVAIYRHIADTTTAPTVGEVARVVSAEWDEVRSAFGRLFAKRVLVLE